MPGSFTSLFRDGVCGLASPRLRVPNHSAGSGLAWALLGFAAVETQAGTKQVAREAW